MKLNSNTKNSFLFFVLMSISSSSFLGAQQTEKEALAKLSFIVGDWKGESAGFENGKKTKTVIAHEKVQYILDGDLITIDLDSPSLTLHTIIGYKKEESSYFYQPFTKNRSSQFKGELINNQFVVYFNPERRLIFERTAEGAFHEYGEQLKDGGWEKYFEDILYPVVEE